jgi:hypothetical protein
MTAQLDKSLSVGPADEDTISIDEASRLLGVTRQRIQQDGTLPKAPGARGRLLRTPVATRHRERVLELGQTLERLRLAGHQAGISDEHVSAQVALAPAAEPRELLERLLAEITASRSETALAQAEIDRLKSELRRADHTIAILRQLVDPARPAEDLGLDAVPTLPQ